VLSLKQAAENQDCKEQHLRSVWGQAPEQSRADWGHEEPVPDFESVQVLKCLQEGRGYREQDPDSVSVQVLKWLQDGRGYREQDLYPVPEYSTQKV